VQELHNGTAPRLFTLASSPAERQETLI